MDPNLTIEISCQGYTKVPIDELKDLQGNLKDLTEENYVRLRNSMTKFGFSFPVFMWIDSEGTKWVIDAHQRLRTLRKMKEEGWTIPDLPADIIQAKDKVEAKKKLLLLNSRYGKMTREGFDEFVDEVGFEVDGEDIEDLLVLPEIEMFGEEETNVIEDEAPEISQEPAVSKLGEVYQLGRHRLMCGDATKIEDVEKLMDGQKADMVLTDPPYNTGMQAKDPGDGSTWLSHMFNDNLTPEQFKQLITDSLANMFAVTKGECVFYICIDWRNVGFIKDKLQELMKVNNVIVWDKVVHGLGSDYKFTYEMIVVGKKGQPKIENRIGTDYQDIWRVQRTIGRNEDHATAKPLSLLAKPIAHASKQDDIILDLFGGSGSTLIACEQTNRTCYMMEIDPKYCDVIRKRYAKFIGKEENWQEVTPIANS